MATVAEPAVGPVPEVRQTKMLIGGEWRDSVSGKTVDTVHPAPAAVIASVSAVIA